MKDGRKLLDDMVTDLGDNDPMSDKMKNVGHPVLDAALLTLRMVSDAKRCPD